MIGVVVWASEARHKAVIWCEDQGALAYLQGQDNLVEQMSWPVAGDLLELETEMIGNLRHAREVRMISESWCPSLPEKLRETSQEMRSGLRLVASQDRVHPSQAAPTMVGDPQYMRTTAAR